MPISTVWAPGGPGTDQSLTAQTCSRLSPRRRSSSAIARGLSPHSLPWKLLNRIVPARTGSSRWAR